jgi:hypothetical protein
MARRQDLEEIRRVLESERLRNDALEKKLEDALATRKSEPTLVRRIAGGVATTAASIIIGLSSVFGTAYLEDFNTPPCVAQSKDVAEAVKGGIDQPENLQVFTRRGCPVTPAAMARKFLGVDGRVFTQRLGAR